MFALLLLLTVRSRTQALDKAPHPELPQSSLTCVLDGEALELGGRRGRLRAAPATACRLVGHHGQAAYVLVVLAGLGDYDLEA